MKNFSGVCQAAGADKPLRAFFIWITNIVTLTNRLREGFVFSYISAVGGGRHPYNPLEVSAEKAL